MTIRWGIIGCGDVARRRVAQAILDDPHSTLQAACRRDVDQLSAFAAKFGIDKSFTNTDALLRSGEIDAVYIATPVYLHKPQAIAAAMAGIHVLVEKPMAMSAAECRDIIDACDENRVKLGVAYYRRFYPVIDRIRSLIRSGAIGSALAVDAVTATTAGFDARTGDETWRVRLEQSGGGVLMDLGSHRINLLLDLFGPVDQVKAVHSTVAANYQAENCAALALRFHSRIQGTVRCYFGAAADPDEFSVLGTDGRLISSPLNTGRLMIQTKGGCSTEQHPPAENFNSPLIADFVAAIQDNREPLVDGEEGLRTNEILDRAYEETRG